MSTRNEKDKQKQIQDKCQAVLNALLRDEDNKYCVDCDSKGPRWASWNLGVFLCIRCAGIHRNLGVHISKVKSVNLDSWTPEQVVSLQQMGNSRARAVYEANLPDNFRRPQSDPSLESFVRAKYEHKKYIAREWVPPAPPKVDWEKEIDEEMERQKRKKKAQAAAVAADKKLIKLAEVPQLPKPKAASPKPVRPAHPDRGTQDLLGLQNGEDGFTGFLSAPAAEQPRRDEAADTARAEEESFFNQPAPSEKERTKLTKDSILALYGSAPQPPVFGAPFQPQAYPQFQGYAQQFPAQNGLQPQFAPAAQFTPQFGAQGQFLAQFPGGGTAGQFAGPAAPFLPQQPQFGAGPAQFGAAAQFPPQQQPPPAVPNPFFGSPAALQQPFSNLSLAGPAAAAKAGPLPSNLWQ